MKILTLAFWQKLLVVTHRWTAIAIGLLFIPWILSGIVLTFWAMPSFTPAERWSHLAPLDLSTAQVEPMEAARRLAIKPTSLRLGMSYDGRPIYRFQGNATAYADTGQPVPGRDANQAVDLVRQFEPANAATVRYEALLAEPDVWTAGNRRTAVPLHKIAVGDAAQTNYYISPVTGEPVMKTDRSSRFWGYAGEVIHLWYFTTLRQNGSVRDWLVKWGSFAGNIVCLSGLITGIWRFSVSRRFRRKGQATFSPYSTWLLWHHYAGLIFGVVVCTWIFSGALEESWYRGPSIEPTVQQRLMTTGGPIKFDRVTLDSLRKSLAAIAPSFRPKEADVFQFRGEPYLVATKGPSERALIGSTERDWSWRPPEYRMVWLNQPERGTFTRFDDAVIRDIAREAMPGVAITEAVWINEYDNYYRTRFGSQPLPALRVKYGDPTGTWLYIDPQRGTIALRMQQQNRQRRWLYNGLHKFDLPYVYDRPILWATSIIVFSLGCLVLSVTTVVPMFRRLRRHIERAVARVVGVDSRLSKADAHTNPVSGRRSPAARQRLERPEPETNFRAVVDAGAAGVRQTDPPV